MTKKDLITVVFEQDGVRSARFAARGREGWTRISGSLIAFESQETLAEAEETDASAVETPLVRALVKLRATTGMRKIVLSLPLSRLLVHVLHMPVMEREDMADAVALQMDKLSPFSGEDLTVGYEVLRESESEMLVFAVALPEAVYGEISEDLNAARLHVLRTDLTILGWLRSLYAKLELVRPGRRILLTDIDQGWDLLIMDQGVPVLARGLGIVTDDRIMQRELTLSLMNAELDAGSTLIEEVIVLSEQAPSESLQGLLQSVTNAGVRHIVPTDCEGGVNGVALRSGEGAELDITPQSWRVALREAQIRRKVIQGVAVAMAIWTVFMSVLFAGPLVFKRLTDNTRRTTRSHHKEYQKVADTRERVNLILAYTDRTWSPLEMLRLTSAYLPYGITLIGFNYKRDDSIRISGEADQATQVYMFKDDLTADPLFDSVTLTGPSISRGKHKFDVDIRSKPGDES